MPLEWTEAALIDRRALFDYIAAESPAAALRVDTRIQQQTELLRKFPALGRIGRVAGTRELVIQQTPCIIVYLVQSRTVRLLRMLHGAQQWPGQTR